MVTQINAFTSKYRWAKFFIHKECHSYQCNRAQLVDANAERNKNSHVKNLVTGDLEAEKIEEETTVGTNSVKGYYQNMTSWPVCLLLNAI
jgi:hypothetical protein